MLFIFLILQEIEPWPYIVCVKSDKADDSAVLPRASFLAGFPEPDVD